MKIFALVVLVIAVLGLAQVIESTARPETGRQGIRQEGQHEH